MLRADQPRRLPPRCCQPPCAAMAPKRALHLRRLLVEHLLLLRRSAPNRRCSARPGAAPCMAVRCFCSSIIFCSALRRASGRPRRRGRAGGRCAAGFIDATKAVQAFSWAGVMPQLVVQLGDALGHASARAWPGAARRAWPGGCLARLRVRLGRRLGLRLGADAAAPSDSAARAVEEGFAEGVHLVFLVRLMWRLPRLACRHETSRCTVVHHRPKV